MAWMDSTEVAYIDASTCFSEEEWKLLQEWQKDLYRNVMNEIHQALMSLGPLITSTVFSLRAKENEELCSVDNQYMNQRQVIDPSSDSMTNHEELFLVNNKKRLESNLSQGSEDVEMNDFSSTGLTFLNDGQCLNKEEPVSIFIDHLGEEITESLNDPNSECDVGPYHIKDEATFCMDHKDLKRIESIVNTTEHQQCLTKGLEVNDSLMKSHMVEDSDNGSIKRRKKGEEPMKGFGKSAQYNSVSRKRNKEQLQSLCKERISTCQVPEMYPELKVEKTIPGRSALNKPVRSNLHQGSSSTSDTDLYSICGNRLTNEDFTESLLNTQQSQKGHDKICSPVGQQNRHIQTHLRIRPFACTACEKSFFEKSHLISHYRTHSGEKPYTCTFCHKSFNRKDNLNGHVRIHTGERPYTCGKCQKNFRRKSDLNLHKNKHSQCKTTKEKE